MAPHNPLIAVHNLDDGFDIYSLKQVSGSIRPTWELKHDTGRYNVCLPLKFIHEGHALVGGNSMGSARVWSIGEGKPLQTLQHRMLGM